VGLCLGPYGGSGRRRFFVIEVSLWCLPPRGMVKGGANARVAWGCRVWRHAGDTGVPRSQETGILKTLALFVKYEETRDNPRPLFRHYRGTSIIRNTPPVGPYGRTMRRLLGGGAVSYDRGTPVFRDTRNRPALCFFSLEKRTTTACLVSSSWRLVIGWVGWGVERFCWSLQRSGHPF
jgi:hypothetical protein